MFDLSDICAADRSLQRGDDDGWVTINGTHVMISGGKATGGAAGSKLSGYDFSKAKSTKSKAKTGTGGSKSQQGTKKGSGKKTDADYVKDLGQDAKRPYMDNLSLVAYAPVGTVMKISGNGKNGYYTKKMGVIDEDWYESDSKGKTFGDAVDIWDETMQFSDGTVTSRFTFPKNADTRNIVEQAKKQTTDQIKYNAQSDIHKGSENKKTYSYKTSETSNKKPTLGANSKKYTYSYPKGGKYEPKLIK